MAKIWLTISLMGVLNYACAQKDVQLNLCFQHVFNGKRIHADSTYILEQGDSLTLRNWKYYLGNLMLDEVPVTSGDEKYALVDAMEGKVCLSGITKPGIYRQIRFRIGIDSADQSNGVRSGALDPLNNMYWTWNSGYIAFKLEGESPSAPPPLHRLEHHLGGYRAGQAFQPEVNMSLGYLIELRSEEKVEWNIDVDLYRYWKYSSINAKPVIMKPGPPAMEQTEAIIRLFEWGTAP